jgi:polysaccharide export outer membrane protein
LVITVAGQSGVVKGSLDPLSAGQSYILGTGDRITIRVTNTDQIGEQPFRIERDGTIEVPLLGVIKAAGHTVEQLEGILCEELRKYVRDPQVIVTVTQFRTQAVTLSGDFRSAGIYDLVGRHTLTEMLAAAGGLGANASRTLRISRQKEQGPIGLPSERLEANGTTYVANIDISVVLGQRNPADDFVLKAFDVIQAVLEDPIYVSGAVARIGPVELGDHKTLGLYQVINLAGGLTNDASKRIKIYRPLPDSVEKQEIDVNLDAVLKGLKPDFPLKPRDVVIVSHSPSRAFAAKATGVAVGVATGVLVAAH